MGEISFMDLRHWDRHIEEIVVDKGKKKKKTILIDKQIARTKKIYNAWQSGELDEIRDKDFPFVPSKYIEFVDRDFLSLAAD
ncbi:MAG: hypothetical protein II857_03875 [Selenomonadaceae bacterium]|nr:hypothetical protein [Selenomonadaceae bacterium]